MTRIAPLLLPFALAACVQEGTALPPVGIADRCNAATFEPYIGRPVSSLDGITFPQGTRIVGPNDAVTMDNQPSRLNIVYDGNATITQVYCG